MQSTSTSLTQPLVLGQFLHEFLRHLFLHRLVERLAVLVGALGGRGAGSRVATWDMDMVGWVGWLADGWLVGWLVESEWLDMVE